MKLLSDINYSNLLDVIEFVFSNQLAMIQHKADILVDSIETKEPTRVINTIKEIHVLSNSVTNIQNLIVDILQVAFTNNIRATSDLQSKAEIVKYKAEAVRNLNNTYAQSLYSKLIKESTILELSIETINVIGLIKITY